jgi:hypothetical protein
VEITPLCPGERPHNAVYVPGALPMNYVMLINAAVSLIMGCALVLVWRVTRRSRFTRFIGWANLVQLLVPLIMWPSQWGFHWDTLSNFAMMVVAAVYSTLLLWVLQSLRDVPFQACRVGRFGAHWQVNVAAVALDGPASGPGGHGYGQYRFGIDLRVLAVEVGEKQLKSRKSWLAHCWSCWV